MEHNATILNSSDKVLMHFVALGEGDVSTYDNLMGKAPVGSTYLDRLNEAFYEKMDSTGAASDWTMLGGTAPTKAGVFPMPANEVVLGISVGNLQENVEVGLDDKIRGNLRHISGWEEFSSIEEEQSGHYLSLFIPRPEGTTSVKVQKDAGEGKTITSEVIVARVEESTQTLKVTITTGTGNLTRTLDLSELKKM